MTRTWTHRPGHPGELQLTDVDGVAVLLAKVSRAEGDSAVHCPYRLTDDPVLTLQVLLELCTHDVSDAELGAFSRLILEPTLVALRRLNVETGGRLGTVKSGFVTLAQWPS